MLSDSDFCSTSILRMKMDANFLHSNGSEVSFEEIDLFWSSGQGKGGGMLNKLVITVVLCNPSSPGPQQSLNCFIVINGILYHRNFKIQGAKDGF